MARRDSENGSVPAASSNAEAALRAPEGRGLDDDVRYRLFKLVEEHPEITQREAAEALGVSLGKANYCFRALIRKGFVKARNFRNSKNKIAYAYLLTPRGIEEKMLVTRRFLDRKLAEYDALVTELHELTREVNQQRRANGEPEVPFEPAGRGR
jgi:MarR family transcriptional regulator, temperature-dependent positive regulator of motility